MTITMVPLFRGSRPRPLLELMTVHFVAITTWIEAHRRLPAVELDGRLPNKLGVGVSIAAMMLTGSLAGYALASSVAVVVSTGLLFMTPLYFLLSLVATAQSRMDIIAILAGCALAPVLYRIAPGFDLVATGIIGGTVAFLLRKKDASPGGPGDAS
jgi:hypothetical protein